MAKEIKTLKDIEEKIKKSQFSLSKPTERERQGYIGLQLVALNLLKQEAIKWIKVFVNPERHEDKIDWIKHFFNITEGDLK